jgi:cytochrome P450
MLELQVLVPTLLGALRFELDDQAHVTPQARMTLRPSGPVRMRVREAEDPFPGRRSALGS